MARLSRCRLPARAPAGRPFGRIANEQHHRKSADDGNRHGDEREQRHPEPAEKDEDHDSHKHDGDREVRTTSVIVALTKTVESKNT